MELSVAPTSNDLSVAPTRIDLSVATTSINLSVAPSTQPPTTMAGKVTTMAYTNLMTFDGSNYQVRVLTLRGF